MPHAIILTFYTSFLFELIKNFLFIKINHAYERQFCKIRTVFYLQVNILGTLMSSRSSYIVFTAFFN